MKAQRALYWLTQTHAEIPPEDEWLTPHERAVARDLKTDKRRADWILGRWTAKHALRTYPSKARTRPNIRAIEIRTAADGAPEAFLGEARFPAAISLSHSAGVGMCVVTEKAVTPGCDVEFIEDRSEGLISDYFLDAERSFVLEADAAERALRATLIWSAKESALKVLRKDLPRSTRSVRVQPHTAWNPGVWNALSITCTATHQRFYGWWRSGDGYLVSVAADTEVGVPIALMDDSVVQESASAKPHGPSGWTKT